jgi:DNA-binding MarR family transcriptional regulator
MAAMTPTPAELLALRHRVPDSVLLDWLDLAQLLEPPCKEKTADLIEHWHCSQSAVSRRLSRLWEADLLDYRPGGGGYRIRHLGPSVTDCDRP